jgi:hypothetical protein
LVWALRSFLGLASYYCKFIKNLTKIAMLLINLLKKSLGTYEWDETMQDGRLVAFENKKLNDME